MPRDRQDIDERYTQAIVIPLEISPARLTNRLRSCSGGSQPNVVVIAMAVPNLRYARYHLEKSQSLMSTPFAMFLIRERSSSWPSMRLWHYIFV